MILPENRLIAWGGGSLALAALGYAAGGAFAAVAAGVAAACWGVACCDLALSLRRSVCGTVVFPERVDLARRREGTVEFSLIGWGGVRGQVWPEFPPEIGTPQSHLLLERGEGDVHVRWPVLPEERGKFRIARFTCRVRSPLSLWGRQTSVPVSCELVVYPDLLGERRLIASLTADGSRPLHPRRQVGQGREFEKLRAYLPGDSMGDIHWKGTAKRGTPVTKVFRVERTQDVYCLIDASLLSGRTGSGGDAVLERLVTAALALGLAVQKEGDRFGLMTFSDRVHGFVRAGSGRTHFGACRDVATMVSPQPVPADFHEAAAVFCRAVRKRALVILLTSLDDPGSAESFMRAAEPLRKRHLTLVATMRSPEAVPLFIPPLPEDADAVYGRLAGHLTWQSLEELGETLRRKGIDLIQAKEERYSATLVSRYLDIKRRQLL